MPSAPRGVAVPAGQRCSERSCHTEQEPGKLLQSLALRFTICLTPCDGSQEEMLLGGKGKKEIKGAKQDKPSQQHLPPLLSPPPLCPRKRAATSLKSRGQHLSVGQLSLIQTFLKCSFIHHSALLEEQPAEEQILLLYHPVSGAI